MLLISHCAVNRPVNMMAQTNHILAAVMTLLLPYRMYCEQYVKCILVPRAYQFHSFFLFFRFYFSLCLYPIRCMKAMATRLKTVEITHRLIVHLRCTYWLSFTFVLVWGEFLYWQYRDLLFGSGFTRKFFWLIKKQDENLYPRTL